MGAVIKTIATKDDITNLRDCTKYDLVDLRYEFQELRLCIRKTTNEIIWWMFFFAIANVASTFVIFYLFLKK